MTLPDAKFRLVGDEVDGRRAVQRMRNEVRGLGTESVSTGRKVSQMSTASRKGATESRRFALGVQNASFQVGDFAVQMASGTNWIRAASQQLPQLLGGMGVLGAVAGAVAAIVGAFAMSMLDLGNNTKSAAERLGEFGSGLGGIRSSISSVYDVQTRLNNAIRDSGSASGAAASAVVANSKSEFEARKSVLGIELELMRIRQNEMRQSRQNLLDQNRNQLSNAFDGAYIDAEMNSGLLGSGTAAPQGPLPLDTLIPGEKSRANYEDRQRQIKIITAELALLGIGADEAAAALEGVFTAPGTTDIGSGKSSGGGAGKAPKTPTETAIEKHIRLIKELAKATKEGLGSSLGAWGGYFDGLVGMTGTKNARLLALGKSFAAAQATIDAWQAHNAVLKDPTLPWWARIASAAKVLASGLGAVRAIQGVTAGGGSGSSTAAGGTATAANVSADQTLTLQFTGSTWQQAMMADLARQIIPALNEVQEAGGNLRISVPS